MEYLFVLGRPNQFYSNKHVPTVAFLCHKNEDLIFILHTFHNIPFIS